MRNAEFFDGIVAGRQTVGRPSCPTEIR